MTKYSYKFKKKVVLSYSDRKGSYRFLANLYGIPSEKNIEV